jgi:hypothetical protein
MFLRSKVRPVRGVDNLTAICESRQCGILNISEPYTPPRIEGAPVTSLRLVIQNKGFHNGLIICSYKKKKKILLVLKQWIATLHSDDTESQLAGSLGCSQMRKLTQFHFHFGDERERERRWEITIQSYTADFAAALTIPWSLLVCTHRF